MKQAPSNRKGAWLRICEIYGSVQGEGLLTGTPSVFVRTSGCNLRCWFCDTPFSSWHPEGEHLDVAQICQQVFALNTKHVVLTGGEPLIYKSLHELCDQLRGAGQHLTIETAGTIYRELACDLVSISPKLSGSAPAAASGSWQAVHHARRERLEVVRQLMHDHPYQLKFVVDNRADAEEVLEYLERLGGVDGERVLLMPQGTLPAALDHQAEWLLPWCQQHELRFCPRAHIHWYGNRRGT